MSQKTLEKGNISMVVLQKGSAAWCTDQAGDGNIGPRGDVLAVTPPS